MGNVVRLRQYAAAKTTRSTGAWSPVDANINELIGQSGAAVRARVRQLVRDFPYFARAVNVIVDYVVGDGIKFQSRVPRARGKGLNAKVCDAIEEAYKRWAEQADITGRLHIDELARMAKRQDIECGEFLFIKRESKNKKRFVPFCLQPIEADRLTAVGARVGVKNAAVEQGVEYDTDTGETLAYHFADEGYGKASRVLAEDVIHGFETLRPGQLRGISPFTPGVIVTRDLQDLMDAEIDGAKMAAKWLAFVKVMDPALRQQKLPAGLTSTDDTSGPIESLENGILEYLRPGEEVELSSNPRGNSNFPPFIKLILGMLSVTTGVPYELLSGDYQGLNYTVSRTSRNDFAHSLRPIATRHIRHFYQPVTRSFLESAVLSGKLDLKGYFTNPLPYQKCEWKPPGTKPVDPLKEIKANADKMALLLASPQAILAEEGRDYEEVVKEIAAAKALAAEYGLEFGEISTAMQTNPAALTGDDEE